MDIADRIDINKLRQINRPGYTRSKLTAIYVLLFAFSACAGALLNTFLPLNVNSGITERISEIFLPDTITGYSDEMLYKIIYNAVDIFKISFIILIAGFTYISSFLDRSIISVTGIYYGYSAALCSDLLLKQDFYSSGNKLLLISLLLIRMLIFYSVIIYSCVISELYSDYWKRYRNVYTLMKSWHFWKYILLFLVLFGYVILTESVYMYLLKIIL